MILEAPRNADEMDDPHCLQVARYLSVSTSGNSKYFSRANIVKDFFFFSRTQLDTLIPPSEHSI